MSEMKVEFSSIEVSDLEDTGGRWDKQDPAVRITIGKQVKETKRQKDAGVEASFPDVLDFELPDGTLKQEVYYLYRENSIGEVGLSIVFRS